jgi:hypothetical protein
LENRYIYGFAKEEIVRGGRNGIDGLEIQKWQRILYDVLRANHQLEEELNYSNMAFKAVPPNGREWGIVQNGHAMQCSGQISPINPSKSPQQSPRGNFLWKRKWNGKEGEGKGNPQFWNI